MKQLLWWSPTGTDSSKQPPGRLLSHRWVQTYVFELPHLKPAELEASLRYKVQATLPINVDTYVLHTQLFHHGKKTYGAAFLASLSAEASFPRPATSLRVGVPLFVPANLRQQVLLFVATPEGLESHYYEAGLLTTSFTPISPNDLELRERILAKYPDAELLAWAPDQRFPLPGDLHDKEAPEPLRTRLMNACPGWQQRQHQHVTRIFGAAFLIAGLLLGLAALQDAWRVREKRNEAWAAWLKTAESKPSTPSPQEQTSVLRAALGAPVPEVFEHLAAAWGGSTKILNFEWAQGKLSLTATSPSALASVRDLTRDPWFRSMQVVNIKAQKDGSELFTLEGGLSFDS